MQLTLARMKLVKYEGKKLTFVVFVCACLLHFSFVIVPL